MYLSRKKREHGEEKTKRKEGKESKQGSTVS
jgi:hypothetical protein